VYFSASDLSTVLMWMGNMPVATRICPCFLIIFVSLSIYKYICMLYIFIFVDIFVDNISRMN